MHSNDTVGLRTRLRGLALIFAFTVSGGECPARPLSPPPKTPALPEAGTTVYFKHFYTEEYLAENPRQKIGKIVIELTKYDEGGECLIYVRALMKGEKRPVYSARGFLSEKGRDSGLFRFQLDREAGRFSLELRDEHVVLRLEKTDFMTLSTIDDNYDQTGDDEQLVSFNSTDDDNNIFKLIPASADEIEF